MLLATSEVCVIWSPSVLWKSTYLIKYSSVTSCALKAFNTANKSGEIWDYRYKQDDGQKKGNTKQKYLGFSFFLTLVILGTYINKTVEHH